MLVTLLILYVPIYILWDCTACVQTAHGVPVCNGNDNVEGVQNPPTMLLYMHPCREAVILHIQY